MSPLARMLAVGLLALPALALPACSQSLLDEGDEDQDEEVEPVEQTNDELRSAVACAEKTEQAYSRGTPRTVKVITVGGKRITKATGHAFLKMQHAADAAGVRLSLTSGFRTMAEQQHLYNCYRNKSCNGGRLAARPGYSNHQNGLAVDVSTSSWLARNAGKYGFVRTVSGEPWHYEYRGKDPGGPCGRGDASSTSDTTDDAPLIPDDPTGDPDPVVVDDPLIDGAVAVEAPREGVTYANGIWMRARAMNSRVVKVVYVSGNFTLGDSDDPSAGFAVHYTFGVLGERTVTAQGYDASGKKIAESSVTFSIAE
jgi:hypothetical protein